MQKLPFHFSKESCIDDLLGGREGDDSGRSAWHEALGNHCQTSQGSHWKTVS